MIPEDSPLLNLVLRWCKFEFASKLLMIMIPLCTPFCLFQTTDILAVSSSTPKASVSDNTTISAQYSLVGTIIAAFLASGVGIYTAVTTAKQNNRNNELQRELTNSTNAQNDKNNRFQIELANVNANLAKEIEELRNKFTLQKDEEAAIRDYQYDARKRLYQDFEPLLFQLNEQADSALFRIKKLASASRDGKLIGWLAGGKTDYFLFSTVYRLLSPLAVFRLMQHKLTIFDLDLVPSYKVQYLLGKSLYYTFSDDLDLSYKSPYYPDRSGRKQGIYTGIIDKVADALIKRERRSNETIERVKSISEFEEEYVTSDTSNNKKIIGKPFIEVSELFKNFHPKNMPILWRILLVQAIIYEAMKKTRNLPKPVTVFKVLEIMSGEERQQYDWRATESEATDTEVFDEPFNAIQKYILSRDNLKDFFRQ